MVRAGSSQKTDKNMDLCVSKIKEEYSDVVTQDYDKNQLNMN